MEIELKLLVAPEHLHRLRRVAALGALRRGRSRSELLHSVYYDTAGRDLARAGIALRLRRSGGRWVQALKGGGGAAAGLHQRTEHEWPLADNRLDLALLDDTPWRKLFREPTIRERLVPVFVTEFRRSARMLAFPDGTVAEMAVDEGVIRAGRRSARISEIEFELKGGEATPLFDLALAIGLAVPMALGHASKAERGYALAAGVTPPPRKAGAVELEPSLTAIDALRRVALACLAQMHANEPGVLAGQDPEYLHQFRVGMRRLRSCLSLVALAVPRERLGDIPGELGWLGQALNPARDWDVFMTETLPPLARLFTGTEGLASFRARGARLRSVHRAAARAALASYRYQTLLLTLGRTLAADDFTLGLDEPEAAAGDAPAMAPELPGGAATPAPGAAEAILVPAVSLPALIGATGRPPLRLNGPAIAFAAGVLDRRARRVKKRGPLVLSLSPEERHEVRIAAKKLRYAAEFFAPLFPKRRVSRFVAALQGLQDILGALNDAATVDRLLAEVAAAGKRPVDPQVSGIIRGWFAAVATQQLARFDAAWREFAKQKPFWR